MGKASQFAAAHRLLRLLLTVSAFSCDITLPASCQALRSACSVAVGRAVLGDVSHGAALAQAMALAMAIFALGPITVPLLGFALVALAGWRAILIGMAVFAGVLLAAAVVWFSETKAAPDRDALPTAADGLAAVSGSLAILLGHPVIVLMALAGPRAPMFAV